MLPDCLDSVRGLADEIVLVDTGSTDRTRTIARAHRARILRVPWTDDFSAARNASLEAARGEFVLVLDADERLAPEAHEAIRRIMREEPADAPPTVHLPLIDNRDAAGHALGADFMPRLWRNRAELRFTGRVHERVGRGVPGLRRAFDARIRIVHLGYDPARAAERGKRARNRALLEAERAERPDDPVIAFYLAKEDYAEGHDAEALRGFLAAIAGGVGANLALSSTVFATECLRNLGRFEEAIAFAREGLARAPDYGDLWFVAGQTALEAGDVEQAIELLRNAWRVPADIAATAFRDPSVREWRADQAMARALLARGGATDIDRAFELLDGVRARVPPDSRLAADLDEAEARIARGEPDVAWHRIAPHLDAAPADVAGPLLMLVQACVADTGLAPAYALLCAALRNHPVLLHQLPLVGAAAELAEALEDTAARAEWLHICTLLDSPHPEHYTALADMCEAVGDDTRAAALRTRVATLRAKASASSRG